MTPNKPPSNCKCGHCPPPLSPEALYEASVDIRDKIATFLASIENHPGLGAFLITSVYKSDDVDNTSLVGGTSTSSLLQLSGITQATLTYLHTSLFAKGGPEVRGISTSSPEAASSLLTKILSDIISKKKKPDHS